MAKDLQADYQKRAKAFLADFEILQNKHNINVRPIIARYGPDLELGDKLSQPAPVNEEQAEAVKKV